MALGQPVVGVCVAQNIQRSRLCVNDHPSANRIPLLSPAMMNVSAKMSAEGGDASTNLKLATSMKSMKRFQSVRRSNCPHLTSNYTHVQFRQTDSKPHVVCLSKVHKLSWES